MARQEMRFCKLQEHWTVRDPRPAPLAQDPMVLGPTMLVLKSIASITFIKFILLAQELHESSKSRSPGFSTGPKVRGRKNTCLGPPRPYPGPCQVKGSICWSKHARAAFFNSRSCLSIRWNSGSKISVRPSQDALTDSNSTSEEVLKDLESPVQYGISGGDLLLISSQSPDWLVTEFNTAVRRYHQRAFRNDCTRFPVLSPQTSSGSRARPAKPLPPSGGSGQLW